MRFPFYTRVFTLVVVLATGCTVPGIDGPLIRQPVVNDTPDVRRSDFAADQLEIRDSASHEIGTPESRCPDISELTKPETATVRRLRTLYEKAIRLEDGNALASILTQIEAVAASELQPEKLVQCLALETAYAIDVLRGTRYVADENSSTWVVQKENGDPMANPVDFKIGGDSFYLIDSGTLYQGQLPLQHDSGGVLTVTAILTHSAMIDGFAVQEISAVDVRRQDNALFVLDKSSDIYQLAPQESGDRGAWRLLSSRQPGVPQYVDVAATVDGLYILDVANNQIWFQDWWGSRWSIAASGLNWDNGSLGEGIDILLDNETLFVLLRQGQIWASSSPGSQIWSLPDAGQLSHVLMPEETDIWPVAIASGDESDALFVADRASRRIVVVDKATGATTGQISAPDRADFDNLQGLDLKNDQLFVMVDGSLMRFSISIVQYMEPPNLRGTLSTWTAPELDVHANMVRSMPNHPAAMQALKSLSFQLPIAGAELPDRPSLYPGARRSYRYGIHRGLDFFADDSHVPLRVGTPVLAAAEGTVMRADHQHEEMSAREVNAILEESWAQHRTAPEFLDKLGGRQVWIDHGQGIRTVYSHLDRVEDNVQLGKSVDAGQVIGYVGVSGTPDGIYGLTSRAHLHFEIWMGEEPGYYVGQWLSLDETRRIFETIFDEKKSGLGSVDVGSTGIMRGNAWVRSTPLDAADHYWLSSPFSEHFNRVVTDWYPFGSTAGGVYRPHHGIDISNPTGTPVLAMANGSVMHAGPDNPELLGPYHDFYGNTVVVRLDKKISVAGRKKDVYVLYGHLSAADVSVGQRVRTGDQLGEVGMTGIALGPHLHLEVRVGQNRYTSAVNPVLWLPPEAGAGHVAVRLIDAEGRSWDGATLTLTRSNTKKAKQVYTLETYRSKDGLDPDPVFGENGVATNVEPGVYRISTEINGERVEGLAFVRAGKTAFAELRTKQ